MANTAYVFDNRTKNLYGNLYESVTVRLMICVVINMIYLAQIIPHVSYMMFFLALASLKLPFDGAVKKTSVAMMQALVVVWVMLAALVYYFDLSPLKISDARAYILSGDVKSITLLISSQFLFLLTTIRISNSNVEFIKIDRRLWRGVALSVAIIATLQINPTMSVLGGGYSGNTAEYWSGLPLVFILSISAWILLQRSYAMTYALVLNVLIAIWLLNGNRSEIFMLFVYGNYLVISKSFVNSNPSVFKVIAATLIIFLAYILFSFIGVMRVVGINVFQAFELVSLVDGIVQDGRLNFQTFGSSIYSVIASVSYVEVNGLVYGETFIGQFKNVIPSFLPVPWDRYQDITSQFQEFQILGGLGLIGEGYVNFGLIGPALVAAVYVSLIKQAISRSCNSFLWSWLLLSVVLYSPRFFLYGFVYFFKLLTFFGAVFLVYSFVRRIRTR
jgi:hypothetical protein